MYEYFGNLPTVEMIAEILLKLNTVDKRQGQKETDREFRKIGNGKRGGDNKWTNIYSICLQLKKWPKF